MRCSRARATRWRSAGPARRLASPVRTVAALSRDGSRPWAHPALRDRKRTRQECEAAPRLAANPFPNGDPRHPFGGSAARLCPERWAVTLGLLLLASGAV